MKKQLTRHEANNLINISPYDKEYFIFEKVNTGLSKEICTYGYKKNGKWIKIKEAKENNPSF